jgi:hypothetical protein
MIFMLPKCPSTRAQRASSPAAIQVFVLTCLFPMLSRSVDIPNTDPISERQRIAYFRCYTHPRPMPQLQKMLARMLSTVPEHNIPPPTPSNARPIPAAKLWVRIPKSDTCIRIESSRMISERVGGMCSGTPVVGLKCINPAPRHLWKGGRWVSPFVAVLCSPGQWLLTVRVSEIHATVSRAREGPLGQCSRYPKITSQLGIVTTIVFAKVFVL